MKEELGIEAKLQVGAPGEFRVDVDGMVVAAKHVAGFPTDDEIVDAVAQVTGG